MDIVYSKHGQNRTFLNHLYLPHLVHVVFERPPSIKGQIMLTIHIFWRPEIFKPRLSWWPISFLVQLHKFQPHSQICIHIPMRLVWIFRSGRKEKSAEKEGKKIQRMCTAFAFDLYSLLPLIVYCSCIDASNIILM